MGVKRRNIRKFVGAEFTIRISLTRGASRAPYVSKCRRFDPSDAYDEMENRSKILHIVLNGGPEGPFELPWGMLWSEGL